MWPTARTTKLLDERRNSDETAATATIIISSLSTMLALAWAL